MSRRQYPRLGHGHQKKLTPGATCYACGQPATGSLWIEWSYMRGEDEYETVCGKHADMARANFRQFIEDATAYSKRLEIKP